MIYLQKNDWIYFNYSAKEDISKHMQNLSRILVENVSFHLSHNIFLFFTHLTAYCSKRNFSNISNLWPNPNIVNINGKIDFHLIHRLLMWPHSFSVEYLIQCLSYLRSYFICLSVCFKVHQRDLKALGRFMLSISSLLPSGHFGKNSTTGNYTATGAKLKQPYEQVWEAEAGLVLLCLFKIFCFIS